MATRFSYIIRTDLPPEGVTRVAVEIYLLWMRFALGEEALNGKKLHYPTGRYASSISYKQIGESTVAIMADDDLAPEALFLETGHRAFDFKTVSHLSGRALPMHRPSGGAEHLASSGLRRVGSKPPRPSIWAVARAETGSGFASFGPDSPAGSWWIPPMPAYAPALTLAGIARRTAAFMEGRGG